MDTNNKKVNSGNNGDKGPKEGGWSAFGLVSAIGLDLAICTVGGTYLGMWLDDLFGTEPWLLLVGIMLGLTAGILGIVQLLKAFGPESKR
jgi:F0F1-type ATP synthase assembly protein I